MQLLLLLLATSLVIAEELDPRQVRLLLTSDFENGTTDPWQDASPGAVEWIVDTYINSSDAPEPLAGQRFLSATKNSPSASGLAVLRSPNWEAQPGDEISLTFWIRSKHFQENTLEVYMVANGTEELLLDLSSFSTPINFEWRTRKVAIPISQRSIIQLVIYGFCGPNSEDAIALDDIIVGSEQTTSTTPSTDNCGSVLNELSGVITSPNYPFDYGSNIACKWEINGPENSAVELSLVDFGTQLGRDYLTVYDGPDDGYPVLLYLSGSLFPSDPVLSTENHMTLTFTSDGSIQGRGFYAVYRVMQEDLTTTTPPTTTITTTVITTTTN